MVEFSQFWFNGVLAVIQKAVFCYLGAERVEAAK